MKRFDGVKNILFTVSYILEAIAKWAIVICLLVMFGVTFMQVVARYIFHYSFFWVEEVAIFAMAWLTFLGASIAIRRKEMLSFEFLKSLFPRHVRAVVGILGYILMISFLTWIVVYGFKLAAINLTHISPALTIPMTYPYLSVPIGGIFLLVQTCILLLLSVFDLASRQEEKN
jgi:TRAP-type C4-dicarboxylate transport system permease small subunit